MSSKDRDKGWATPKRCISMEKELHFINLKPLDATVVKDSSKRGNNSHRCNVLETPVSISKSQAKSSHLKDQIYHQVSETTHQSLNGSVDSLPGSTNGTSYQYEQSYERSNTKPPQDFNEPKEEIVEQKNVIIQKQKSIISQLRQTNMELEELLIQKKHELRSSNNERMQKHLREYQHDITLLKQQIAEEKNAKATEIDKLQRQLGKSEYEYGKLEIALKEMEISKSGESGKIMKELKKREMELKNEQQKNMKVVQEIKVLKHQNQKLQAYLEELATAQEVKGLQTELKNLKNEKEEQQMKYHLLEKEINSTKSNSQEKDAVCKKLQQLSIEQKDEIISLKNKLKKYHSAEEQGGLSYKEQEDIVTENVKLRKENVELRLSLQKRQQKLDDLFKDSVQQKLQYEEKNGHVQGIVESLQTDLKEKKIALTKTGATHQELLSDSLRCQKELKLYKERYSDDFQKSLCSLGREIGLCVDDVKSFLNLCISRIKGDEPSLDSLLGLGLDPIDRPDYPVPTLDLEYIKSQLKEMSELRKDVDELRHLVSEHYAQEIGDNMCITQ